jgi:hypothetical protein
MKDFLAVIIYLAGAGAAIDFYIGKAGQKAVRDWMEDWWLRMSDVKWGNFGTKEAQLALEILNRLFGRSLFSIRRLCAVAVLALAALSVGIINPLIRGPGVTSLMQIEMYHLFTAVLINSLVFTISISVTQSVMTGFAEPVAEWPSVVV